VLTIWYRLYRRPVIMVKLRAQKVCGEGFRFVILTADRTGEMLDARSPA